MFEVNAVLNKDLIEKLDNDEHIFWRFQNPDWTISGDHEESWGMIYGSRDEAIETYMDDMECDYDEAEENAILPGKSCMPTFEEIMHFTSSFDNDFVLLAFYGKDTRYTGHDDEYVAVFYEPVSIFTFEDSIAYAKKNLKSWGVL
jgi:hypothetical protein